MASAPPSPKRARDDASDHLQTPDGTMDMNDRAPSPKLRKRTSHRDARNLDISDGALSSTQTPDSPTKPAFHVVSPVARSIPTVPKRTLYHKNTISDALRGHTPISFSAKNNVGSPDHDGSPARAQSPKTEEDRQSSRSGFQTPGHDTTLNALPIFSPAPHQTFDGSRSPSPSLSQSTMSPSPSPLSSPSLSHATSSNNIPTPDSLHLPNSSTQSRTLPHREPSAFSVAPASHRAETHIVNQQKAMPDRLPHANPFIREIGPIPSYRALHPNAQEDPYDSDSEDEEVHHGETLAPALIAFGSGVERGSSHKLSSTRLGDDSKTSSSRPFQSPSRYSNLSGSCTHILSSVYNLIVGLIVCCRASSPQYDGASSNSTHQAFYQYTSASYASFPVAL